MSTAEDDAVYDAERLAFEDTPLGDRMDRRSQIAEAREIAEHPWVVPFVGQVNVGEATVRLATADAYARGQSIRFAPNNMSRYTAVHEIAHVVHRRCAISVDERSHGPEYRAVYAELVSIVYGEHYGRLLREAFHESGLPVGPAAIPRPAKPIIDIDRLAQASAPTRWL